VHGDPKIGFASAILTIRLKSLPAETDEKELENVLRALNINANRVKVIAEHDLETKRAFISFLSVSEVGAAAIALDHPDAKFKG